MSLCLTGKTALVTASTGTLGKEVIKGLALSGCYIIGTDRTPQYAVDSLFDELNLVSGTDMTYIACDLASKEDIEQLFKEIDKEHPGGVDIFVSVGATFCFGSLVEDIPLDEWCKELSINLTSAFMITQYVIPKMKDKGWGRIIYVSSQLGLTAIPKAAAYISSKAGLLGLTRAVAVESAEKGVTVNAVCPGPMDNGFLDDAFKTHGIDRSISIQDTKQMMKAYFPTKKFSSSIQVASFILYLCSPGADNMTGTSTSMDGGFNAV